MSKFYYSRCHLKIFFAVLLSGSYFCLPAIALEHTSSGREAITILQQTISGTILDGLDGKPMVGASVAVKGGGQSTSTDANGSFSLQVPDNNAVLVIRYVGYVSQEIVVGNRSRIEITLQPDQAELAQVVVVGYGTQKKKDITGAVKSLNSDEFNKGIITSPQQLLQGKIAGVNVTTASGEPGANMGITVRGPGGLRTGSTPLFVVDGLPLDNSSTGGGDPLSFINPQDIETMDVLKDASATAIYGARGANGVILITTKKGKAGTSTLGFSNSTGFSRIANPLPVFTAQQFRTEVPKAGGVLDDKGGNTDWQDEITRTGLTQNYNLTLSGGAEKLAYFASLGSQKEDGIIKKNQMGRYSGRFNATQKFLDDRLVVETNINVANTKNNRPPITNILNEALTANPTYPALDAAGKPAVYQGITNPLLSLALNKEITTINRVIGNISPSLRIIKGLVYKLNFGVDNSTSTRDVDALPSTVPFIEGRLESYYNNNKNTLIENYLTWNATKGKHDITALGGHSFQKIFVQGRNYSINKFVVGGVDPIYNPGVGQILALATNTPGGFAFKNELQSFFGRATYQYDSKYLLTATFRADGSSKFGANNKYGYFPSFSLGWRLSEENFIKNTFFSNLMLRAGYGITGNQEIPPKITQALFTSVISAGYPLNSGNTYPAGTIYSRLANPDIQWETSKQTNIGLDFGLLNGALSGTVDVFNKVSDNILLQVIPADPVQPASTVWSNVKDMNITNTGVELDLNYNHTTANKFRYSIGGNVTFTKNKVENSPYSIISSGSVSGAGITSSTINGYLNGQPIGTFFLKEFTGFDANGLSTYSDLDGDKNITDKDRISAGTALPDKLYSLYGSVGFKGFDLSVNMNGVSGNKIYDYTGNVGFSKLRLAKNVNATPESVANTKESINNAAMVSTRYLKDGAYFRLNNASLGYNFNTKQLGVGWVSALRLSVTGQNLFVITKYDGFDPEVNADRAISGVSSYGIDFLSYPKAKAVIFGLNLSF